MVHPDKYQNWIQVYVSKLLIEIEQYWFIHQI